MVIDRHDWKLISMQNVQSVTIEVNVPTENAL